MELQIIICKNRGIWSRLLPAIRFFCSIYIAMFLFHPMLSSLNADCQSKLSEDQKIEKLIIAVSLLDGTFIRNGEEHNARDASEHLRLKLTNAKKSFFSSGKEWTARQFIEQLATKSSLSGLPYEIVLRNGKRYYSAEWLNIELKKINEQCSEHSK
jgi:hypothetical protein